MSENTETQNSEDTEGHFSLHGEAPSISDGTDTDALKNHSGEDAEDTEGHFSLHGEAPGFSGALTADPNVPSSRD